MVCELSDHEPELLFGEVRLHHVDEGDRHSEGSRLPWGAVVGFGTKFIKRQVSPDRVDPLVRASRAY
jgi:hypothetical protein